MKPLTDKHYRTEIPRDKFASECIECDRLKPKILMRPDEAPIIPPVVKHSVDVNRQRDESAEIIFMLESSNMILKCALCIACCVITLLFVALYGAWGGM